MSDYDFVGGLKSGSTEGQFVSSYTDWLDGQIESHADFIAYILFQQGGMSLEQATGLRTALQNGDFTVSDLFLAAQSKTGPLADIAGTPSPVLHVEGYDPIQLAQFMGGKELVTWTSGSGKNLVTHTREALDHFNGDAGAPQGWDQPVAIHVNEAPVVSPIEISITESQTAGGAASGIQPWDADLLTVDLLSGATDMDGGALSILNLDSLPTWATLAQDGHTLIIDQNSRALDHLKVGEHDSLTLNFQVSDGQGGVVDNHITINLTGTNDLPTVAALVATATETAQPWPDYGTPQNPIYPLRSDIADHAAGQDLKVIDLLAGASDKDGDALHIVQGSLTMAGGDLPAWASLDENGNLVIDQNSPALDYLKGASDSWNGGDPRPEPQHEFFTFNFQVSDGHGGVVANSITIDMAGSGDFPKATPLSATFHEGSGIQMVQLLDGVTDPDGDQVMVGGIVGSLFGGNGGPVSIPGWMIGLPGDGSTDGHTLVVDLNSHALDFLSEGEHLSSTVYAQLYDNHGVPSVFNPVTVDVVGTNDAPTVAGALIAAAHETQSVYNTAHQITNQGADILKIDLLQGASDVDHLDTLSIVQGSLNFGGNSLPSWASLDADGHTLLIDQNSRALDVLKNGETKSFAFDYKISDGHAEIGNTVTVDLTGTADQYAAHANGDISKTFTAGGGNLNGQSLAFTLPNDGGFDFNFSGTLAATQTGLTGNEKSTIADFNSDDGFNSFVLNNGNPDESVALSDAALDDQGVTFNVNWGGGPANGDSVLVDLHWQADYWIMA